ncbi:TetR/AcrR family transcriptional regulator [Actinoalloteichus sp. AHMU CJ021]|uniref:TetR/AcrR family transcriptional regulator n=1 Tax=Actinoalloteichus TaxID=65496 RepID=UPI00036EA653|nr:MULTISPECIES: TetR/AcrR family transcriptional regulator [Actinoalloteichus]AUS78169.1 TetR/AcrR family transcriptional regulator [Actinoalloteichus sp. AHMU CJ021]
MSEQVGSELVQAALAASRERGQDVADVPLTAIAEAAGISRSTLLRRLGGTRARLDEAVRDAGIDPGGRRPVRERAVEAAATLIGERGLGAVTLDAVAAEARCSLPSLHTVFGGRDGLLGAVFDRYSPVLALDSLRRDPPATTEDTVRAIYRAVVAAFQREPRVIPAIFGDMLSRPGGPAGEFLQENFPRLFGSVGELVMGEVRAGRVRPLPMPLLVQLLVGPMLMHLLLRPVLAPSLGDELPSTDRAVEEFTAAFLRSTRVAEPPG